MSHSCWHRGPIEFQLKPGIEAVLKTLALRAHEKRLEFLCRFDPEVPPVVVGDPDRLRQVLVNLAGNAIKFTGRGEVSISVTAESRVDNEVIVHFAIADTGIGIAKEKQKSIFDSFAQADGSSTRRYGGTGLGLSISEQLVRMMGGGSGLRVNWIRAAFSISRRGSACPPGRRCPHLSHRRPNSLFYMACGFWLWMTTPKMRPSFLKLFRDGGQRRQLQRVPGMHFHCC